MAAIVARILNGGLNAITTLVLFTYTDFKTIVFPVTAFAVAVAPIESGWHFSRGVFWIWLHLLQCNVSNQYKSVREDAINRPWRPLPAGRISRKSATILRWALVPICMSVSARYGADVALTSGALTLVTVMYDEFELAGHWFGKNASAAFGYTVLEIGATKLMGPSTSLDNISAQAILVSALIILTTVHAQDFPDVDGDLALGRMTFPIYAPELSRLMLAPLLLVWSIFSVGLWEIQGLGCGLFCVLGLYLGWRYYTLRARMDDRVSYLIYNLWLLLAHLLPVNMRYPVGEKGRMFM